MITIGDLAPEELIVHEFRQLREEGADPGPLEERWSALADETGTADRRRRALELLDDCRLLRRDDGTADRRRASAVQGRRPGRRASFRSNAASRRSIKPSESRTIPMGLLG
ncbi:MAG: hypothetical protein WD314_07660 [Trueperaceae bacterium]